MDERNPGMFSKLGNITSCNYCILMGILSSAKRVDTEDSDGLDNSERVEFKQFICYCSSRG